MDSVVKAVASRIYWSLLPGTRDRDRPAQLSHVQGRGHYLSSNQIPIPWWLLQILPSLSFLQFISPHMLLILSSKDELNLSFFFMYIPIATLPFQVLVTEY